MKTSTNKLNQAIERMTTGYKINGAKDNAANYSISTNMTTKIGAYQVAQDNAAMGLDMLTTASESLSQMENLGQRLRSLSIQARNGTYGAQSLKAIQEEANSLIDEINRLYNTAKYNGISLFNQTEFDIPEGTSIVWRATDELTVDRLACGSEYVDGICGNRILLKAGIRHAVISVK